MKNPLRSLYDWVLSWADKPGGNVALYSISLAESSFFPIPPDPLLIAFCLSKPKESLKFAFFTTLFSVIGGVIGYLIGVFLFETVGKAIINFYNYWDAYNKVKELFDTYGFIAVMIAGFTPIPYKVFTIASGSFYFNLPLFIIASILSRGARFFLEAVILLFFGEKAKEFIDKYFDWLAIAFVILLVGGFLILRYVI
ncbi:MAG: YqaA family protein [Spirochaetia bacterium]|nr:DedA family protein [Spirochaetota bacterium]MCX8097147.1 DedA family protein [Spirochaetota bacterium]MDW8113190.1 YqaA family protein [Spirochaetia bacterium]